MSNSTNIDALLTAVDQATRPFKALQTANVSLSDSIKATEKILRGLYDQVAQIDGFTQAKKSLAAVSAELKTAQQHTQALAAEMRKSGPPTRNQTTELERSRDSVSKLRQQHDALRNTVIERRSTLLNAGIKPNATLPAKLQLKSRISDNQAQLTTQQQALKQENRQTRVEKLRQKQQSVQAIAGKVSTVGNTSMTIAKSGFNLGKKLLQPGYTQSLKNTGADAMSAQSNSAPTQTPAVMNSQNGNLGTDLQALQTAYQSLSVDIFSQQESSLRSLVQTATAYLGQLQQWVQNNQGLVQTFGLIATVVIGVAGAIGTVAGVIAPVFTGISTLITIATTFGSVFTTVCGGVMAVLGSLTLPIIGVVAAIAAGALAIYTYWEPISAFFSGVIAGIGSAFAPLGDIFAPLQPLFDLISSGLQNIKQLFSDLLTPVQASQETLNSCANAGVVFGQMLSGSIALVIQGVKVLSSGLAWVLETLGIIDKKPALEVPKPPEESSATGNDYGYIQPTSSMPGFNSYKVARPAGGNNYTDQSRTDINVTLQGDISPGSDNSRHLMDLLEQHESNKRDQRYAQFNAPGGYIS